jgi:hypothetical protein
MPMRPRADDTGDTILLELPMAIHHLMLPNFIEPPPRIPVVARYAGPVLAAGRRPPGYQFLDTDRPSEGRAWLQRIRPKRG